MFYKTGLLFRGLTISVHNASFNNSGANIGQLLSQFEKEIGV